MLNILNFPDSTVVNKPVPKTAFWQRAERQTAMKEFLTEEFESITWLYKLAASTLNVADGESVHEIDVFYCKMRGETYSLHSLSEMDKLIPRHTLYIIESGNQMDFLMQHKEAIDVRGERKWRIETTERLQNIDLNNQQLRIEGQSMDAVYASLLSQISELNITSIADYKEQTAENEQKAKLQKQIEALENKARKETQPRRKFELVQQINALQAQLYL